MALLTKPPFPFPFIGAGAAAYYESCAVYVRFVRVPQPVELRAIKRAAPTQLHAFRLDGKDLLAAGDLEPRRAEAGLNAAIERWLIAAHETCPIAVAVRPEDLEAGGTKLSAWHVASVKKIAAVLAGFDDVIRGKGTELAGELFARMLSTVGAKALPARFRPWVDPVRMAMTASDDKALAMLRARARKDCTLATACMRAADLKLHSDLRAARKLYDVAIENPDLDPRAYCNALFTLKRVGREDPKQLRAVAQRFIDRALPHAAANPTILLNVAALRLEHGDRAGALAALELAAKRKAPELPAMRDQPAFAALRGEPRFDALFARRTARSRSR